MAGAVLGDLGVARGRHEGGVRVQGWRCVGTGLRGLFSLYHAAPS